MSPSWTAGKQELDRKKLETSAGWIHYPAANEEEVVSPYEVRSTAAGHTRFVFRTCVYDSSSRKKYA